MAIGGRTILRTFRLTRETWHHLEELRHKLLLTSITEALEVAALLASDYAKGRGIALDALTPFGAVNQAAGLVGVGKRRHDNAYWRGVAELRSAMTDAELRDLWKTIEASDIGRQSDYQLGKTTKKRDKPRRAK